MDRVRELYDNHGISTVLVAGGSGAFLDVADHVLMLDAYTPKDKTEAAKALARPRGAESDGEQPQPYRPAPGRTISLDSPRKPPQAKGLHTIRYGQEFIDVSSLSQLVDPSQTRSIAAILSQLSEAGDGIPLRQKVEEILQRAEQSPSGVDSLSPFGAGRHPGRLALPRVHEVMAAVNRYRRLKVRN